MRFAKVIFTSVALALIAITHAAPVDPTVPIDESLIDPPNSESYYLADPEFALEADEENGILPDVNAIVQHNYDKAVKNGVKAMGLIPGINDYSCKPSKDKPFPLVLVHGTAIILFGMDKMENSAQELKVEIDNILEKTGAKKVDIVGYSQGTLMPRYYQRYLGGSQKINKYAGIASIQSGTTLSGLRTLFERLNFFEKIKEVLSPICAACFEMEHKSDWLQMMNNDRNTEVGVNYFLVMTTHDEVVTPYTNGILNATASDPGQVQMRTLQNFCSVDMSEHILMPYDPIVFHLVNSFLDPQATQSVNCWSALK
ncbi:hypothetical protein BGZ95_005524 [Linnemannia exigua]|uniref:Lipase n=1 Tax=Linnemannia exigua TaxID=604196 RepID=A0AAD4D2C4_9FUNG|nr:hypothetical protein BGZ95_005524 [Linnemannia exigua]